MLGTKNIDWRAVLYCNQIEVNAEVLPVSLTHQGSLGVLTMNVDLVPSLSKTELLMDEQVTKQTTLESRYESDTIQRFLDYAHDWWVDFKAIRSSHEKRLVKIFAETDDREASVFKPVCSLVAPMMADRLLESPLHAARFVSLIPFQRLDSPGVDKVEVWHSMQSFLSRVSSQRTSLTLFLDSCRLVATLRTTLCSSATCCSDLDWTRTWSSARTARVRTPG